MKLCRFLGPDARPRPGLCQNDRTILDLTSAGIEDLDEVLEHPDPMGKTTALARLPARMFQLAEVRLLPPVVRQEIWAAGVTYLRSRKARRAESDRDASVYDRVYHAPRPELFFKALPHKVVGPGEPVGVRRDARWSAPEPELALVLNSRAQVVGLTIGNDVTARDLEGVNPLYLPQAKTYDRSCALGPWILLGRSEAQIRRSRITLVIRRERRIVFRGETAIANLRRSFDELTRYLFHSSHFPHGAILLTGTGIVPPDTFTLLPGDVVRIQISGIGTLENPVCEV